MANRKSIVCIALFVTIVLMACGFPAVVSQTPTPVAPTPTAIPGWEMFAAGNSEIWLPDSFYGGDLSEDLDLILEKMRSLGPEFEQIALTIEQNPSMFVLFVFDSNIGLSGIMTSVNIVSERVLSGMTVETYVDATLTQFPSGFIVVERESVSLNRYQAERLTIEALINGREIKEIMYLIKEQNSVWVVTISTGQDEFDQRSATFELSMDTFTIHP